MGVLQHNPPGTRHRRTNRQVGLLTVVRALMHSEFKRAPTDPMPVICYLQRHSIRLGWDTSVVSH